MRNNRRLLLSLAAAGLFVCLAGISESRSQATAPPPTGAWLYNPAHETTVTGTVSSVTESVGRRGWAGTHLELSTGTGTMEVHVGPSWYLEAKKFPLAPGDTLAITGSSVTVNDQPLLLARTIVKNGSTLTLRNEHGFPLWSQRGRR